MFHLAVTGGPPDPSGFCGVYVFSNFAKLSVTLSVRRSSPPAPPVEIDETMTSPKVSLRYSSGLPPALRTVKIAAGATLPSQQNLISVGLDESTYLVTLMSLTFTLPAPPPVPTCVEPDWVIPQLHESTSISPACFESVASPLTSPNFKN